MTTMEVLMRGGDVDSGDCGLDEFSGWKTVVLSTRSIWIVESK